MMSMPGVRAEEVSSAPSESQAGECVQPARAHAHGIAEPAAMSLSEAVTAVRAERDMLLVALDTERAAHANAVAQRDAALQRFQAMDEQAQLEHEEIEAAIIEFERIAKQERHRADAAEQALKQERAAFMALREADLELERRTSMAEPPAGAAEASPLEPAGLASQQLPGAEEEDLLTAALVADQRAEDAIRRVGDQLLEKRRARMEKAIEAASALAQLSIQRDALKCGAFGELVCAAAAAAVRPDLTMSEAVRYVERPPPPPPPSPPMGLARQLAFRSRRSVSSGSLPSLTGLEQHGAMEVWKPDTLSWQLQAASQAPSQPPPSSARQGWVQF